MLTWRTPTHEYDLVELRGLLIGMLSFLPPREETAIWLRQVDNWTWEEIGVALGGISRTRAKQIYYRGMRRARRVLIMRCNYTLLERYMYKDKFDVDSD